MPASERRTQVGKRGLVILAVIVSVLWIVQLTPAAFLPKVAADFAGGIALGLWIGVIMNWFAARP